jgi:choline kinase
VKGVVLAAGASRRLRPLTDELPKCLLDVAGDTILGRALAHLEALGIEEVVFVTGYLEPLIKDYVRGRFSRLWSRFVTNPDYETTNNAHSLLLAAPLVAGSPFVLMDSDIVFERDVLGRLLASAHEDCLALRPASELGAEEVKCEVDGGGRVVAIGKEVPPARAAGESIGMQRFSGAASTRLFQILEDRVRGRGLGNEFYEASFQQFIDEGGALFAVSAGSLYCEEIDTAEDLRAARERLGAP